MIQCPYCQRFIGRSSLQVNDTIVHESGIDVGFTALCQECSRKFILCCLCDTYVTKYDYRRYFLTNHMGNVHSEVCSPVENYIGASDETMGDDHNSMGSCVIENIHDVSDEGVELADNNDCNMDVTGDEEECLSDRSEENCVAPCVVSEDEDAEEQDEESSDEEDQDDTWQIDQSLSHACLIANELFAKMNSIFEGNFPLSAYFYHQYQTFDDNCNVAGGIRGIVHRSLTQKRHSLQCENEDTSKLYFTLLLKLHGETKADIELTLTLINEMRHSFLPYLKQQTLLPRIPTNTEEANQMILTSCHSMLRNLPVAGILDGAGDDDFHALSSLQKTIDIMMGLGTRPSFIQNEFGEIDGKGLNGTQAANDILQELREVARRGGHDPDKVAIGWITLWSDSFLASWIKQKLNSAWVMTMTVAHPDGSRSDNYTFILAIGPSKTDHHQVVAKALREVEKLRSPKLRYCGATNTFFLTAFDIIAYLSDRPERSNLTYSTLLGTFGKRFQWAAFCGEGVSSCLPSCKGCYRRRVRQIVGVDDEATQTKCNECADWDYTNKDAPAWRRSSSLSRVFTKGSEDYPTQNTSPFQPECRTLPELSHIRPMKQSFGWLTLGMKVAYWNYAFGAWKYKYLLENYLRTFAINQEIRDRCYDKAKAAKVSMVRLKVAEKVERLNNMCTTEELFKQGVIPAAWLIGSMRKYPDVPMHLVFTGITCDMLTMTQEMMVMDKLKTKFNESFTQVLNRIKSLKLEWLKTDTLPDTQWASENYLAIARLFPFLVGYYEHHSEYSFCVGGVQCMTPSRSLCLRKLCNVYSTMLGLLMRKEKIHAEDLDGVIKLFLSCVVNFEKSLKPSSNGKESIVFSKGNLLSLLNLPEQVEYLGPARHIWEGNSEFYIQTIKKDINHVRHSSTFFQRKLQNHQRRDCVDFLRDQLIKNSQSNTSGERSAKRYHRYVSAEVIENALVSGLVLSVIIFSGSVPSIQACFGRKRDGKRKFVRLKAVVNDEHKIHERCGLLYCKFTLEKDSDGDLLVIEKDEDKLGLFSCGTLLSFGGNHHFGHSLITEDWKSFDENGCISFPSISKHIFSDDIM